MQSMWKLDDFHFSTFSLPILVFLKALQRLLFQKANKMTRDVRLKAHDIESHYLHKPVRKLRMLHTMNWMELLSYSCCPLDPRRWKKRPFQNWFPYVNSTWSEPGVAWTAISPFDSHAKQKLLSCLTSWPGLFLTVLKVHVYM